VSYFSKNVFVVVAVSLFFGCAREPIKELDFEVPKNFSIQSSKEANNTKNVVFDKGLERFINLALEKNLDVKSSLERIEQARLLAKKADADLLPSVDAKISKAQKDLLDGDGKDSKSYSASISASYELSIWGRVQQLSSASEYSYLATLENHKQARLNIIKEISSNWYKLAYELDRQRVYGEQIDTAKKVLEIIKARYLAGKAIYSDLLRYERELEALQGERRLSEIESETLKKSLLLLAGKHPNEPFDFRPTFGVLPESPDLGIPSETIFNLPSVKAAFYLFKSNDAKAAAALLDRYPKFTINLGIESTSSLASNLFEDWILSTIGAVAIPLFNGEKLKSEYLRSQSVAKESSLAFTKEFLESFKEIEDSYARDIRYIEYAKSITKQKELAKESFERSFDRYSKGVVSYLDTLNLLTTLQTLEIKELSTKMQTYTNRINLYHSLGEYNGIF